MSDEEVDKLWKEMGLDFFYKILPVEIEWDCTWWDYTWERWESCKIKSNSCKRVEKYIRHQHSCCSDLSVYPNTAIGRDASCRSRWD